MKFYKYLYLFFALILSLSGCRYISLQDENVSCSISEEDESVNCEYVSLYFSGSVNKKEAEECVSLNENLNSVSIEELWNDKELKVKPKEGWKKGILYQFSFEGSLSINNQNITTYIKRSFYYGEKNLIPEIDERRIIYPEKIEDSILIEFTRPLKEDSLKEHIQFNPTLEFNAELINNNKSLKIKPISKWKVNTCYSIKLKGFQSIDSYTIAEKSLSFTVGKDMKIPDIKKVCRAVKINDDYVFDENKDLEGIKTKDSIGIIFTKKMDYDSVKNGISLSPYLAGNLITADKDGYYFVFIPDSAFNGNEKYEMTIKNNIKDYNGLQLQDSKTFVFTPEMQYIKVLSVKINSSEILTDNKNCTRFIPTKTEIITNNDKEIKYSFLLLISFSSSFKKEEYKKVSDNIKLNLKFPYTVASPVVKNISWISDNKILFEYENIFPGTQDQSVFYELKINGGKTGIKNQFDEYLEENECYILEPYSE